MVITERGSIYTLDEGDTIIDPSQVKFVEPKQPDQGQPANQHPAKIEHFPLQ